jgi:hypothetical protein
VKLAADAVGRAELLLRAALLVVAESEEMVSHRAFDVSKRCGSSALRAKPNPESTSISTVFVRTVRIGGARKLVALAPLASL